MTQRSTSLGPGLADFRGRSERPARLSRRRVVGLLGLGAVGVLAAACAPPGPGAPIGQQAATKLASVWSGRTVTLVVSETAGGGYDSWARLVGRHLGRYLPGTPSIVVENVTGGGGRVAMNRLYQARPDGLSIGLVNRVCPEYQLRGEGPDQGVRFDVRKMTWLGSSSTESHLLFVHGRTGVSRVEQLTSTAVKIGHQDLGGLPHTLEVILRSGLAWAAAPRTFGWDGSNALLLAVDRGDIDGALGSWSSLVRRKGDEFANGTLRALVQVGGGQIRDPLLDGVPIAEALFAKLGDEPRQLLALAQRPLAYSRPFVAPPGLEPGLAETLRQALLDALGDQALLAEAQQLGLEVDPLPGQRVQALIGEQLKTPGQVVARLTALIEADTPR
jgi:tripartite-type tricarboxylate transporter receptor subunit TctC